MSNDHVNKIFADFLKPFAPALSATVDYLFGRLLYGDSDECVAVVREFESLGYGKASIMPYLKRAEQWREDFGCGGQAVRDAMAAMKDR